MVSTKASLGVKRSRGYSVHRALQGPIDTENPEAKDPWPDTHQLEGGYAPRQTQVPLGAAASASAREAVLASAAAVPKRCERVPFANR